MWLMDKLVETGTDMLSPLDQTEGMDLATIKKRFGHRLTLVGGLEKYIFEQYLPEMECRLLRAVAIGSADGGYILMETGGLPDSLTKERFDAYLEVGRRERGRK